MPSEPGQNFSVKFFNSFQKVKTKRQIVICVQARCIPETPAPRLNISRYYEVQLIIWELIEFGPLVNTVGNMLAEAKLISGKQKLLRFRIIGRLQARSSVYFIEIFGTFSVADL